MRSAWLQKNLSLSGLVYILCLCTQNITNVQCTQSLTSCTLDVFAVLILQKFRKAKMGSLRKKMPKEAKALKEEALMLCNGVTFDFIAISKVRARVYQ
jgi:hypothetical protein